MTETDDDTYKLNSDGRNQTLRVSLINNEQISLILTNISSNQRFSALITLEQFMEVCEAFKSCKNSKEGLQLIKDTIEAGNIMIVEDPQENGMEIKFNVTIEDEQYPAFDIKLDLENENENERNEENDEDVQVLPPTFDYQGNQEAETRYGTTQENTTENLKDIVQSDVKPPILQLEYIEPILQVHYPDGTTKSHALPPRIQSVDGQTPNITEEQLKSIQEQMNKNSTITNFSPLKDFLNNNRSNSVVKKHVSAYSTQSMPYPGSNNLTRVNPFENNDDVNIYQKQTHTQINQIPTNFQYINQDFQNNFNNYNKTSSGYSSMTIQARPFAAPGMQFLPNPLLTNLNNTNIYQNNNFYQGNNIIEQRPRMLQKKSKYSSQTSHPRDAVRSQSTPSHDNYKFNRNTNAHRKKPKNYPFQSYQDEKERNHREKYPYDRNTERHPGKNKAPHNKQSKKSNVEKLKENLPKNSLTHIQRQQQRLLEVQQKLAEIQRKQKELQERQKEILLKQKNQRLANQNRQQIRVMPNQQIRKTQSQSINTEQQFQKRFLSNEIKNPPPPVQPPREKQIRQTNSITNNSQNFQHQTSQEVRQAKTQMINPSSKFKAQTSQPIPSQTPSLANDEISQKLINLAQMASMQNQANPDFKNLQAITLEQQNQVINNEEQEEVQEYQPQVEQEQEQVQEQQYEEVQNDNEAEEEAVAEANQGGQDINIEQLFFTEDGRVIFRNGLLRGIIHKYAEIDDVVSKIQDILGKGVKFTLAYKAFDIGDNAKDFHEKCDKLNMSLVLIETDKDIRFGGFTTQSWEGNNKKKKDNNAFVFSLETNKIFNVFPEEPAIGCYPKFGPVFFGCQIRIYDQFFTKGGTTCHKGLNYNTDEDYELNNGQQKFLIKDIEIYNIETIDI